MVVFKIILCTFIICFLLFAISACIVSGKLSREEEQHEFKYIIDAVDTEEL